MDLISMLFISTLAVTSILVISDSERFDPEWIAAACLMVIMVCKVYDSFWLHRIERQLRLLNTLISCWDGEVRPELRGAFSYLLDRLKELWKWGKPNV